MKYLVIFVIIIASFIYINKNKNPENKHICQLKNSNIITIGDSLANGFGVTPNDSFAIKTAKLLNKNPIKMGINGETTIGLLQRIDGALKATSDIAAIIISIGGNDFLRGINKEITESNLDNIVTIAKKYTNCIVLLGVPSGVTDSILGNISPIYSDISKKHNVLIESKTMKKILKDNTLKIDQIHPNQAGHEIISKQMVEIINNNR